MCGRCGTSNSQKVTMDFNGAPESWGKNVSKHIKTSIETSQTTPGAKQTQFYHKKNLPEYLQCCSRAMREVIAQHRSSYLAIL